MIDVEALRDDSTNAWSPQRLLTGFLLHPYLTVLRYGDDGPPDDAPRVEALLQDVNGPTRYAIGWVEARGDESGVVYVSGEKPSYTHTWYEPSTVDWIATEAHTDAYGHFTESEAEKRQRQDGIALAIAQALGPDLFITHREHLLRQKRKIGGFTLCDVGGGLALIGLYLRSQDDFRIWFDPDGHGSLTIGKRWYYLNGVYSVLPEIWRWASGMHQHITKEPTISEDDLDHTISSMTERLLQVLEARDAVNLALNQPQTNTTAYDAVSAFEIAVVMLMGALDRIARVTHVVLEIPGKPRSAAWQSEEWVKEVKKKCPKLAAVVTGETYKHVLTILTSLRNPSVHRIRPYSVAVRSSSHRRRTVMSLPPAEQGRILAAIKALGDTFPAWGIESIRRNEFHVDPGAALEQVLHMAANLLNALMRETPVEGLSHVRLKPADVVPPEELVNTPMDRFGTIQQSCARWLFGL